jgi:hypothetical protein
MGSTRNDFDVFVADFVPKALDEILTHVSADGSIILIPPTVVAANVIHVLVDSKFGIEV